MQFYIIQNPPFNISIDDSYRSTYDLLILVYNSIYDLLILVCNSIHDLLILVYNTHPHGSKCFQN